MANIYDALQPSPQKSPAQPQTSQDLYGALTGKVQSPTAPPATAAPTTAPTAATPAPAPTGDPFGGNGVQVNGGWVPKDHPAAQSGASAPAPQAAPTTAAPAPAAPDPSDPFGGNGVKLASGGWVPKDHPLAQQQAAMNPATSPTAAPAASTTSAATGPQTAGQAITGTATAGTQVQQGAPTTAASAFQQALVNRLTAGPVNAQSPEIAGAINANRASEQRNFERQQAQTAELAASQGLDQNAFGSQMRGLQSERALREGQFAGNAVNGLAQQRSQELTAALALGGSMLSQQDQLAMQQKLAELQAQLQREGVSAQTSLGQGDLALRSELGQGNLNLGLLQTLLSNQQFGQNLGAQLGMHNSTLNQQAVLQALGMI